MQQFVHVGFNKMVDLQTVMAIAGKLSAAPVKRLIEGARGRGMLVDMTGGLKPKSAIITDDSRVILVSLSSNTIVGRVNNPWEEYQEEKPKHTSEMTTSLIVVDKAS